MAPSCFQLCMCKRRAHSLPSYSYPLHALVQTCPLPPARKAPWLTHTRWLDVIKENFRKQDVMLVDAKRWTRNNQLWKVLVYLVGFTFDDPYGSTNLGWLQPHQAKAWSTRSAQNIAGCFDQITFKLLLTSRDTTTCWWYVLTKHWLYRLIK